jgi:hypothetical protein
MEKIYSLASNIKSLGVLDRHLGHFVEMQEDSSKGSTHPTSKRIDPVVAEALL